MKFGTQTNSNIQNSMIIFTFSFSDQKYPRSNLVQENKLSVQAEIWLVPGLIRICRIQWRCSLFPISTGNLDFLGKFGTKNQNCQFKLKLGT